MASVNKVILIGNCGRDPEVRYFPSGQSVANVSIATTSKKKDKTTSKNIEETQWHRVIFFDRLAEIACEYLKKGDPVYVEGRLKYGKYTSTSGVEKNTVDIIATEMQLLGSRSSAPALEQDAPTKKLFKAPVSKPDVDKDLTGFDTMDSDIPF